MRSWMFVLCWSAYFTTSTWANARDAQQRDCLAVGQVIYDTFYKVDDAALNQLLPQLGLKKGQSKMLSAHEMKALDSAGLQSFEERAGGSSANTVAGIASLGGASTFVGIGCNDLYGELFVRDLELCGIKNSCTLVDNPKGTGRIFALISEDGDRTMPANFGIANDIHLIDPQMFSEEIIRAHKIIYADAYLWATQAAREVITRAFNTAYACYVARAFSLGSELVVQAHREDLLRFLDKVDILLGNEDEMRALMGTHSQEDTLDNLARSVRLAVMTCGPQGAWIIHKDQKIYIPAEPVARIDTTGAGDMFAAGFLYGISHGYSLSQAGELGSRMSGHIIQMIGGRPERNLEFLKCEHHPMTNPSSEIFLSDVVVCESSH